MSASHLARQRVGREMAARPAMLVLAALALGGGMLGAWQVWTGRVVEPAGAAQAPAQVPAPHAAPEADQPQAHRDDAPAKATPPEAPITAAEVLQRVERLGHQAPRWPAAGSVLSVATAQAALAGDVAAWHAQTQGRRVQVEGLLAAVVEGEAGVQVWALQAPAGAGRPGSEGAVQAVLAQPDPAANAQGQPVRLDCLSRGVLMGTWVLADCRPA